MILVLGGANSGKSEFAESLAKKKTLYIATAVSLDDEFKEKISKHKSRRPEDWDTYEGYKDLKTVIKNKTPGYDSVIIECVTTLIMNLMYDFSNGDLENADFAKMELFIQEEIKGLSEACVEARAEIIVVSNETGLGVVPYDIISRRFRQLEGFANQLLAKVSQEVYFVLAGIPVKIKGSADH